MMETRKLSVNAEVKNNRSAYTTLGTRQSKNLLKSDKIKLGSRSFEISHPDVAGIFYRVLGPLCHYNARLRRYTYALHFEEEVGSLVKVGREVTVGMIIVLTSGICNTYCSHIHYCR